MIIRYDKYTKTKFKSSIPKPIRFDFYRDISTSSGKSLKLVDQFAYLSSSITSTESQHAHSEGVDYYWQIID